MRDRHPVQMPVDLNALLLEEKRRVLREMIATFEGHKQYEAIRLARALQAQLNLEGGPQEPAVEAAAVALRAELLKVLKASSWFWNLKSSQDSAFQSLKDLAAFWPLNNKDDKHEAEDPITLSVMGCPLFLMKRSPLQATPQQLLEMLGVEKEAYVCVANDIFYVYKNPQAAERPQVSRLRVIEPHNIQHLKAILGIAEEARVEGWGNYSSISSGLRHIQMLSITRMTGHDTFNRLYLSTGRQRQLDGLCEHLRREPSDPETREIYGERDREYINQMARQREILLKGNDQGYTPVLRAGARSAANEGVASGSRRGWGFSWGQATTVLGLSIYCVGLVGLCIFSTGLLALASLLAFVVGAVISLAGVAIMGTEEASAHRANQQQAERVIRQMIGLGIGISIELLNQRQPANANAARNAGFNNPPPPRFGGANNFYQAFPQPAPVAQPLNQGQARANPFGYNRAF